MEDNKKIIVIGHGSPDKTEIAKKLAEEHGAEVVVIDKDTDVSNLENITEIPKFVYRPYLDLNEPYLMETIKIANDFKDMGLTNKEKNAEIHPIRNSETNPKIGRNEKCPCGSGFKYKKCCGK